MAVILRVNLSIAANRRRRVGGADSQLLEDLLSQGSIGVDREEISVFAVRVGDPIAVDGRGVYAPFETRRMIADTRHAVIRIAGATKCVRVLERPFDG